METNFIIYKLTNTVNNKIYIGGTSDTLDFRFHRHVLKSIGGSDYPLHKAIREFGEEAFTRNIIEECHSLEQMNQREAYWIASLSSTNPDIGYNVKPGGGIRLQSIESKIKIGNAHRGKISEKRTPILQYTDTGNFIAEYPSITDASEKNSLDRSQIIRSLKKEYTKPSKKNPYIWIYKSEMADIAVNINPADYYKDLDYKPQITEKCRSKSKSFNNNLTEIVTPVAQYSLDGKLLNKYYSLAEAYRSTGVSSATIRKFLKDSNYIDTLKRKDKIKYIWKACAKDDPDIKKTEEEIQKIAAKNNSRVIRAYDESGNLIKEYIGIKAFEKAEHADRRTMFAAILADTSWKGLYWEVN